MSHIVANLPPIKCFVRKEFLYDFEKGHGELEPCWWVSIKSLRGQAFRIEAYLNNYGALYDKLPLHAYVWKTDINENELYPLDWLQLWDCFSYNITVIKKQRLRNARCEVIMKDKSKAPGYYLFTIDSCSSDPNELDISWAETPNEHKSFNIIKLDNGQFAAQPNNRILWKHQSQTPSVDLKTLYFRFSTKTWICENQDRWNAANATKFNYDE